MRSCRPFLMSLALLLLALVATGAVVAQSQSITIDTPTAGTTVGSPVTVTGRTASTPLDNTLTYQVTTSNGVLLGDGQFGVNPAGAGSVFAASLAFNVPAGGGSIRVEITDRAAGGDIVAFAYVELQTAPPGPGNSAGPADTSGIQAIIIDSPTSGSDVGSPMTLVGRTALYPQSGELGYQVLGAGTVDLGTGKFPVEGSPGTDGRFTTSVTFNAPADGGPIRLVVFEQNPETLGFTTITTVDLNVPPPRPPQTITLAAPSAGSRVDSQFQVLGQTATVPDRGSLNFTIRDATGRVLGSGALPVQPAGQGAVFSAMVSYTAPALNSPIVLTLVDFASDGAVAAQVDTLLTYSPPLAPPPAPPQPTPIPPPGLSVIVIDSPASGTLVGSPVVITGRTSRMPSFGLLYYRFTNSAGGQLTAGTFGVAPVGGGGVFNVSLNFPIPPDGRLVRLGLWEQDAAGNILASASLDLRVTPPEQELTITIDTPPAETVVGSPVVITGRTSTFPNGGVLFFRFTDANGRGLGDGAFQVSGAVGQPSFFNASLAFSPPPGGGFVRLEVFGRDRVGSPIANTFLTLRVDSGIGLTDRTWRLVAFGSRSSPFYVWGPPITASFGGDGILRGSAPCLDYDAPYNADGSRIAILKPNVRARNCSEADDVQRQAQEYVVRLAGAESYAIFGTRLEIYYGGGGSAFLYDAQ